VRSTDFIIVGGGIAGLRAALGLASAGRVLVLTKAEPAESNTGYAQGGIAAAVGDDDSPALHAADTLRAGDGLCDAAAVDILVGRGAEDVRDLIAWGAAFDRDADGRLALGREAAHSVRRVLHAGDATGREIGRVLLQRVRTLASVETCDHALATEILVDGGHARGVAYFDRDGVRHDVHATATLLATGGAGQVYRETTNPAVATGDGIALAFHAGARVADLEFVQFHPTALNRAGAPRFLISEALRGEGARLVNDRGEPFMTSYHPDGDLAPRDVVARGIVRESERTGGLVFLTLAHLDPAYVVRRFPTIAAMCRQIDLDLARDPIPVGPAAHYIMGGVDTDDWGRTSLPGLYAAGEVACTGVHGANRLASNSLLEGLVFGARAAEAMAEDRPADTYGWPSVAEPGSAPRDGKGPGPARNELRRRAWECLGLERDGEGLRSFLAFVGGLPASGTTRPVDRTTAEDRNLVDVAWAMAKSALFREESRGAHWRRDFPAADERFLGHTLLHGEQPRLTEVDAPIRSGAQC
jgi:L-aspartate oxidase